MKLVMTLAFIFEPGKYPDADDVQVVVVKKERN